MHAHSTIGHDPWLVVLSLLIAVLASYVGLDLARRGQSDRGGYTVLWTLAGAFSVGMGIWGMHFIGMLAMHMPADVRYDPLGTISSALIAIVAAAGAFSVVSRSRSREAMAVGGVMLGMAVVAMHYLGIASMQTTAHIRHDVLGTSLSIVIAITAGTAALVLAFGPWRRVPLPIAALAMGIAIAGMHYTAMSRMTMMPMADAGPLDATGIESRGMALVIAGACFMILFLGLVTSTFDRRLAQLAQRENEELRRAQDFSGRLLEASNDGIFAFNKDLVVTVWNSGMQQLSGRETESAVGRNLRDLALWGPDAAALTDQVMSGRRIVQEFPIAGTKRTCIVTASAIRDDQGDIQGGLVFVREDTELRSTQEALRQSQKMEALGQMTGSVAHDFNNLVMIIGGNAALLSRRHPEDPQLGNIKAAVDRANGLVKKLLAFSRRQELKAEVVDLHERLRSFLPLIRSAAGGSVDIALKVDPKLPLVELDINEFEIALLNLIVNARDAMPEGGSIRVAATYDEDGMVSVSVSDTGVGMDEETILKAFEPFFTTKEAGKGSGLGLSQVYGFARQSGGDATVRSEVGRGTTVRISLPPTDGTMSFQGEPTRTALVVERHPEVADVTRCLLEQGGREVLVVEDERSALDALASRRGNVDVVVADAGSLEDDGEDFFLRIRGRAPKAAIILASDHRSMTARNVDGLIRKPYSLDGLEAALSRLPQAQAEGSAGAAS